LFLRQFNCASVGKQINFDSIKCLGFFASCSNDGHLLGFYTVFWFVLACQWNVLPSSSEWLN